MLYTQIARNQRLCMRRHPIFEKNKAMKVFSYLFISFWAYRPTASSKTAHTKSSIGSTEA